MRYFFLILFLCVSQCLFAAIIEKDNRLEWYEVKSAALKELARSTAVLINSKSNYLKVDSHGFCFAPHTPIYGTDDGLCSEEKFFNEFSPGYCSAFFVGEDLLVTAGHCLEHACEDTTVLFDFFKRQSDDLSTSFQAKSIYTCRRVVAMNPWEDWAVIQLDRPVTDRTPYRLRQSGEPAIGDVVTVLGFPRGIPLKIAEDGEVVHNEQGNEAERFEAFLDVFGGSSGGPVINSSTLEVEGILTVSFGEFDMSKEPSTGHLCRTLKHYSNKSEASPSWVTRTSLFRHLIKTTR